VLQTKAPLGLFCDFLCARRRETWADWAGLGLLQDMDKVRRAVMGPRTECLR